MMRPNFKILIGFMLGTLSFSFAQNSDFLQMSQEMTSSQLSATGISSLTSPERKALDDWLNSYTRRVLRVGATANSGPTYSGTGKHWIDEVCKDGAIVVLEDDSMWEIESTDRLDTALWLATTDVSVRKSSDSSGQYEYVLRNTEDKETAHAKYLGSL